MILRLKPSIILPQCKCANGNKSKLQDKYIQKKLTVLLCIQWNVCIAKFWKRVSRNRDVNTYYSSKVLSIECIGWQFGRIEFYHHTVEGAHIFCNRKITYYQVHLILGQLFQCICVFAYSPNICHSIGWLYCSAIEYAATFTCFPICVPWYTMSIEVFGLLLRPSNFLSIPWHQSDNVITSFMHNIHVGPSNCITA